jgi:cobalt-zinc-cadmium efflux system outer membrane protein
MFHVIYGGNAMGHSRPWVALGAAALCVVAAGVTWASPAEEVPAITWEEIRELAGNHPALLAAASSVEEADGAVRRSKQFPNPVFGLGLGRAESSEAGEERDIWDLELKLPIPSLGAYGDGAEAAEAEHGAAVFEAQSRRLDVLRKLREAFLRVAHDQERLKVLEASADQLAFLVDVARQRVEMGEARPIELSRLEIEAARVDLALAEAREGMRVRKTVLSRRLGSAMPREYRVQADLSRLPELPSIDNAVARTLSRHPDAGSSNQRLQAASARLGAERGVRFPEIEIGAFYERELDARNFGGTLEFSLPLWNWNSGGIARAEAAEAKARHHRDMTLMEIETAAQESHSAAVSAYARADGFRDVILPKAVEVAAALERMYQLGEVDIMDVLDARRRLIEIESELLEAYLRSQLAYLQLATLTGDIEDE